jgi:glycosyltransferase involved in cell wall biosynthesis
VTGDGQWGIVCPSDDVAAWAAAVRSLADGGERYRSVARAGHDAVSAHFSWPAVFARTTEVILGAPPRGFR